MTTRDDYVVKMKQQLDALNDQMSAVEAKAKQSRAEAKEKYQQQMTQLRAQSHATIAKLDEMRAAGESGWESMVAEMEKMRDAFAHSFNYFKSQV